MKFEYGGYSDTIYSIVSGHIYGDFQQEILSLDSVSISSFRIAPKDTITYSDRSGRFLTAFCKGTFTIRITKKGYQTIKLINFESDPDQVSGLEAVLEKGDGEVVYDIGKQNISKLAPLPH